MFNDFYRPLGMANELAVQLAWSPGSSCCLALHRGGRDFDQRELALLGLVAPHLRAARGRIAAGPRADAVLLDHDAAVAMLARRLPITAREAEVLARLTAGRTNAGIALDLGISPHTVRRHVEKLYAKLDVHTRAGATRMALAAFGD
jgi:DNA-binding CsgD family transcriptional regulator